MFSILRNDFLSQDNQVTLINYFADNLKMEWFRKTEISFRLLLPKNQLYLFIRFKNNFKKKINCELHTRKKKKTASINYLMILFFV